MFKRIILKLILCRNEVPPRTRRESDRLGFFEKLAGKDFCRKKKLSETFGPP